MKKLMKTYVLNAARVYLRNSSPPVQILYLWSLGPMLCTFVLLQICTGLLLVSHHISGAEDNAFFVATIVEYISREGIDYPALIRYAHSSATSFIFALLYLYIGRNLYYRSYVNKPYGFIAWTTIIIVFIIMCVLEYSVTGLKGTTWSANDIKDIIIFLLNEWDAGFVVIPEEVYNILDSTSIYIILHLILVFVLLFLLSIHRYCLKKTMSDPLVKRYPMNMPFFPIFYLKDFIFTILMLVIYTVDILSFAGLLPEKYNILNIGTFDFKYRNQQYEVINVKTKWYFLPFFSIIRSFNLLSLPGVVIFYVLLVLVLLVLFLPCFDTTNLKSSMFKYIHLYICYIFSIIFIMLGFVGTIPPTYLYLIELTNVFVVLLVINFVLISLAPRLEFFVDGSWVNTKLSQDYYLLKLDCGWLEICNSHLRDIILKIEADNTSLRAELKLLKEKLEYSYRSKK